PMYNRVQLPNLQYYRPVARAESPQVIRTDICVYGATSAGVVAAVAARRLGRSAALAAFDTHIGGMSSAGLGCTDFGNKAAIGGISREFFRRLGAYYESPHGEAWRFWPGAAARIFRDKLGEDDVALRTNQQRVRVHKNRARIHT